MQLSRFTSYSILFEISFDVMLVFGRVSFYVLEAWEGPREELGDAWGILGGQLGHPRSILEAPRGKSRERMITCDVGR